MAGEQSPPPAPRSTEAARELRYHLEALRELGPEYSEAAAAAFLEKIDRLIDAKLAARLADLEQTRRKTAEEATRRLILTLVFGIPLTAIAGGTAGTPGVVALWAALVLIQILLRR